MPGSTRETFDRVVDFVATGGYALRSYERYARIRKTKEGLWRVSHPRIAQQYRLNVGTIIEVPALNVRYVRHGKGPVARGGPVLGKIEEAFLETLVYGDTFLFAGKVLRFEGIRENECFVSNAPGKDAKVPYYGGGKFPLSTYLADQVRGMLADPKRWKALPEQVADWLRLQAEFSILPKRGDLLVETFPNGNRFYMVAYPFEGRLAHQTLGMLLTRRLERFGARPLGFVATDYVLGVWALGDMGHMFKKQKPSLGQLFDEDMLGDDLDAWLADSWMLKRTFRACAQISGLIEKRYPGQEKSGRQVTVSADLIYDVLRTHEPDHILLQATRADAAAGLLDVRRLADMLSRIKGRIVHKDLDRISPLAVPIMLEVGRERVDGEAGDSLLSEAEELIAEAMGRPNGIGLKENSERGRTDISSGRGPAPRSRWPARPHSATAAARSISLSSACSASPTCIWKRARRWRGAACWCRPTTRSATLLRLQAVIDHYRPKIVVSLGDSFHDGEGASRLPGRMRLDLSALMAGRDWFWVAGNHDRSRRPACPGDTVEALAVGSLTFRHEPSAKSPAGEIAGHLHPCARIVQRGRSVRRRCFATDGERIVMPAFGAYTGSLNVLDRAYAGLFRRGRADRLHDRGEQGVCHIGRDAAARVSPSGRRSAPASRSAPRGLSPGCRS